MLDARKLAGNPSRAVVKGTSVDRPAAFLAAGLTVEAEVAEIQLQRLAGSGVAEGRRRPGERLAVAAVVVEEERVPVERFQVSRERARRREGKPERSVRRRNRQRLSERVRVLAGVPLERVRGRRVGLRSAAWAASACSTWA